MNNKSKRLTKNKPDNKMIFKPRDSLKQAVIEKEKENNWGCGCGGAQN